MDKQPEGKNNCSVYKIIVQWNDLIYENAPFILCILLFVLKTVQVE